MKTIEEILATDDAHRETVPIPEWDTEVLIVSMTAEERAEIEKKWAKKEASSDPAAFRAEILERSLKKTDLTPFASTDQIKLLMKKNANAIERLFEAACKVSAFSKNDVKELEKNS